MNAAWSYFWPAFAAGMLVGAICGLIAFRRRSKRHLKLAVGAVISLALAGLWHGPSGAAERFAAKVDEGIHQTLVYYEMTQVQARLHRGPLSREIILSGPANDFQRSELARFMDEIPGVRSAAWSDSGGGVPLIAEGMTSAMAGFLLGLLLAYLVELRRRYNSQWKW
jgi:hypothetical protein